MNELRQEIARLTDQLHVKLDRLIDNKLKRAIEVDIVLGKLSVLYERIEYYRDTFPRQTEDEDEQVMDQELSRPTESSDTEIEVEKQETILPPPPLAPEPPPVKSHYEVEHPSTPPPPESASEEVSDDEQSATADYSLPDIEMHETPSYPEPVAELPEPSPNPEPTPETHQPAVPEWVNETPETTPPVAPDPELPSVPSPSSAMPEIPLTPPVPPRQRSTEATGDLFSTPTIGDKLKSDIPSLNDKMNAGRKEFSHADSIQHKPIADLKTTIGINEKFQFINELFEGSSYEYNDAIQRLNTRMSSDEAMAALNTLKIQYAWNEEDTTYTLLHTYVTRRYL